MRIEDLTLEEIGNLSPMSAPEGLYFKNSRGEKLTPYNVYFASDLREWHNDEKYRPGLCYTVYFDDIHGTTLTPVYTPDGVQYEVPQLVSVSAYYKGDIIKGFHR